MEFYQRHKVKIRIGMAIVGIVILLLLLKSCSNDSNLNDDRQIPIIERIDKVKRNPKKTLKNKQEYSRAVSELVDTVKGYENNLSDVIVVIDPYICDEDTANIFELFGQSFEEIALDYYNLKYIGTDTYSDQEYFNRKFMYYAEFGTTLRDMSQAMNHSDTQEVIKGFDDLASIIEKLEKGDIE